MNHFIICHILNYIEQFHVRPLHVEEDVVLEGNCKETVLKNASLIEEDYFVAPPGNIPLEPREDLLHEKEDNKKCH